MNVIGKLARTIGNRLLPVSPKHVGKAATVMQWKAIDATVNNQIGSVWRGFSSCLIRPPQTKAICSNTVMGQTSIQESFLNRKDTNLLFTRSYKAKTVLRLRCSGCYYIRRHGRLFVECTLKPRHKQMAKISKNKIYKDDLSRGNVQRAAWWGFKKFKWYEAGKTPYVANARSTFFEGRKIGVDI